MNETEWDLGSVCMYALTERGVSSSAEITEIFMQLVQTSKLLLPLFHFSNFRFTFSLSRSLECVGDLRGIKDFEVNCQKLTPLQNLITLSHLSLSTIHSLTHSFSLSLSFLVVCLICLCLCLFLYSFITRAVCEFMSLFICLFV